MSDYRIIDGGDRGLDLVGPDGSEPVLLGQTKPQVADWLEAFATGTSIDIDPGIVMEPRYVASVDEAVAALRA